MDTPLAAPIGAPEGNGVLAQRTSELVTTTSEEPEQDRRDQQVVQMAEDNPQPAVPTAIGDGSLEAPAVTPLQPIDAIPPTFSQSSWARRNARIQAARRWIPAPILCRLNGLYVFLFILWLIVTPVIFLIFPPSLAMVIGNAICKAAHLPHFPRTVTAFYIGAAGSWVGTTLLLTVSWFFGILLTWLDNRARVWHVRSGRIPAGSTRRDGHFPVILLWIPFLYPSCLIASAVGTGLGIKNSNALKQVDVNRMAAIGAAIVIPIFVFFLFFYFIASGMAHQFILGVVQGFPVKDKPLLTFDYLYRQMEALVWLLSPRKTVASSTPTAADIP